MAVLVDTSVWVDHLRSGEEHLVHLLDQVQVVVHDFVVGEFALGSLQNRAVVLGHLRRLPRAPIATTEEVLVLIDRHGLAGSGIGWVDAHLLASSKLAGGLPLWSRDGRLERAVISLGLLHTPASD